MNRTNHPSILAIFFLSFFFVKMASAQDFPRDTTYTIYSNHQKLQKKFPFVTPIAPQQLQYVKGQTEVVYRTLGNRNLHLDIFYPAHKNWRKYPGVLLIHGGGWSSGSKAHQVPMAQQLAARGYVAAAVEYRLSPEAPYPAAVHDLKVAVQWLRAHAADYNLDPDKIAALGCSAGAQLASLLGTTNGLRRFEEKAALSDYPSDVQAVVNIDGIVSFVHSEAGAEGSAASKWLGGSRTDAYATWKDASPLEYVNGHTPPFAFINSAVPRFHAGRDDMVKRLDSLGIYSEVHTIADTPHSFWLVHPWFETTLDFTVQFLDKVFKAPAIAAFPGAEGGGKYVTGGRGGKVITVTNLNDSGPGSLRAAIEAEYPRIIVFAVSGTIALQSTLRILSGDLTIAGQSAPGDGICVRNYNVNIDADNVIIRYMRFRLGNEAGQQTDALSCLRRKDILVDHCSMSWSVDETASLYDTENLTVQWCLISESLDHSVHVKGEHGYGGIWGGNNATFHHNLLAHHTSRNPRFCGSRYHHHPEWEVVDFRNNVIFNWGHNNVYGGEQGNYNIVNNYYKAGPATNKKVRNRIVNPSSPLGKYYVAGNYVDGFPEITANNWSGGVQCENVDSTYSAAPIPMRVALPEQSAREAYEAVLTHAGASLVRDALDARIVGEVRSGAPTYGNGMIDSQEKVGGWPNLQSRPAPPDRDHDGMPDTWEQTHGLRPDQDDAALFTLDKGYTNVEVYLNGLAE